MAALRSVTAVALGSALAVLPAAAAAQEPGTRALETGADLWKVVLLTALGLAALLVIAAIGYLYRRQRALAWEFQKPDPPEHDEEH